MAESQTRSLIPDRLLRTPGPFVSLYLDTQAATEQGDQELALRWKNLREDVAEAGAPAETLTAIEDIVTGSQRRGDGLCVIASRDAVVIERYLGAFIRDSIAVRAALGTGADVCVVPDLGSRHGPKHGIGALLRYKA